MGFSCTLKLNILLLLLLGFTGADAVTINFTIRQATYVVGAIAVFYFGLSFIILLVLCRILNCRCCCHKGKVCPRLSSGDVSVLYKGNEFIEIETYTARKKSVESKRANKLFSIPEEASVIPNSMTIDDDSESDIGENSVKSDLHTKTSLSTMITVCDDDDDEMTGRSSELGTLIEETQLFDEEPETVAANVSNSITRGSPLLREIATEAGMTNWFKIKTETPFHVSDYDTGRLTNKSPDVAKLSGSQPLTSHGRLHNGATVEHLNKLQEFELKSKSEIIVKTNPIAGATMNFCTGSIEKIDLGSNSLDPSSSKAEAKSYTSASNGDKQSPYSLPPSHSHSPYGRKPKGRSANSTPNSSIKSSPSAVKEAIKTKQSLSGSPLAKAATPKSRPTQSLSPLVKGAKPSSNVSPLVRKKNNLHPKSTPAIKNSPRLTPSAIRQKAEQNVNSLKDSSPQETTIKVEEHVENELSFI